MKLFFIGIIALIYTNTLTNNARIKIINEKDNLYFNISYVLNKEKINYGRSFGVKLYKFSLDKECKLPTIDKVQWFAALLVIDLHCKEHIIKNINELDDQGADFIFIQNIDHVENQKNLKLNIRKLNLEVPIFIIDNQDIEFYRQLKLNDNSNSIKNLNYLKIYFPDEEETNQQSNSNDDLKIELYYLTSDNYSFMILEEFGKVFKLLVEKISFDPIPFIFQMNGDQSYLDEFCISKGLYCNISNNQRITGKKLVIEGLRQKCIYKVYPNEFFKYIESYNKLCIMNYDKNCSNLALKNSNIDYKIVENCILGSFTNESAEDIYSNNNKILMVDHDKISELNDPTFPSLYVNNKLYKGSADFNDLLLFICSFMNNKINACKNLKLQNPNEEVITSSFIMFGFIIFIIGFIIIFYLCKKYTENKYNERFNQVVGKYVTEYSSMKNND